MTTNVTERQDRSSGKEAIEAEIGKALIDILHCTELVGKHRALAKTTDRSKRIIILANARERSRRLDLKGYLRLYVAVGATDADLTKFSDALDIISDN